MADRSGSQSGGVRNIRAMFEAKGGTDSSPPSRGRSPAASEGLGSVRGDSSSRPLSKVRASFVSVDRASGGLFPGLQRKDSDALASDAGEPQHNSSRPSSGLNGGAPPLVRTPSGLAGVREEDNTSGGKSGKTAVDTKASGTDAISPKNTSKTGGIKGAAKAVGEKASELKDKVVEKAATAKPSAITTKSPAKGGSGPPSAKAAKTPTTPKAPSTDSPRGSAVKPSIKDASRPSAAKAGRPSTGGTPIAQTKISDPKVAASASPASAKKGVETSPGGFVKQPPKSPTRPVKLPAGAVATTTSSSAKTGRSSLSEGSNRSGNVGAPQAKSTLSAAAPTIRSKASRQSLAGSTSAADDSFLARMMRPTQSSASKAHEKVVEPQRASRTRVEGAGSAPKPISKPAAPKASVAKPAPTRPSAAKTVISKPLANKQPETKSKTAETAKPKQKAKEPAAGKPDVKAAEKKNTLVDASSTGKKSETAPSAVPAATPAATKEAGPKEDTPETALDGKDATDRAKELPLSTHNSKPEVHEAAETRLDEEDPVQSVPLTALASQPATTEPAATSTEVPDSKAVSAEDSEFSMSDVTSHTEDNASKASPEPTKPKPSGLEFLPSHQRNKSTKSIHTPNSSTPFSITPRTGTPIAAIVPLDEATLEALGTIQPEEPYLTGTVKEKPSKYVFGPALSPTDDVVAEALSEPAPVPVKPAPDAAGAVRQAAEIEMAANQEAQVAEAGPARPVVAEDDIAADLDLGVKKSLDRGVDFTLPEAKGPAPQPAHETIADEDLVDLLSDDDQQGREASNELPPTADKGDLLDLGVTTAHGSAASASKPLAHHEPELDVDDDVD